MKASTVIKRLDANLQQQMAEHWMQDQLPGKPPSSDGLKKGRQKSLRRAGQQRGHKGRTLMQVRTMILHRLCPHCQTKLAAERSK